MTPMRIAELRQMAGAVDSPKSAWMDELLDEVNRLRIAIDGEITVKNAVIRESERVDAALLATIVERDNLRKMLEDSNQREELQLEVANKYGALLVEVESVLQNVVSEPGWRRRIDWKYGPQDPGGVNGCFEKVKETLHPKPVPMCAPDPLHDIFPATGEGRPT